MGSIEAVLRRQEVLDACEKDTEEEEDKPKDPAKDGEIIDIAAITALAASGAGSLAFGALLPLIDHQNETRKACRDAAHGKIMDLIGQYKKMPPLGELDPTEGSDLEVWPNLKLSALYHRSSLQRQLPDLEQDSSRMQYGSATSRPFELQKILHARSDRWSAKARVLAAEFYRALVHLYHSSVPACSDECNASPTANPAKSVSCSIRAQPYEAIHSPLVWDDQKGVEAVISVSNQEGFLSSPQLSIECRSLKKLWILLRCFDHRCCVTSSNVSVPRVVARRQCKHSLMLDVATWLRKDICFLHVSKM